MESPSVITTLISFTLSKIIFSFERSRWSKVGYIRVQVIDVCGDGARRECRAVELAVNQCNTHAEEYNLPYKPHHSTPPMKKRDPFLQVGACTR